MIRIFLTITFLASSIPVSVSAQSSSPSDTVSTTTTATTPATSCAAQNILDGCLGTTMNQASQCSPTDYSCLCNTNTAILTCFASCPDDARKVQYQSLKNSYCTNASIFGTTSGATATTTASTTEVSVSVSASASTSTSTATVTRETTEMETETSATASETTEAGGGVGGEGGATATPTSDQDDSQNGAAAPRHVASTSGFLAALAGVVVALL